MHYRNNIVRDAVKMLKAHGHKATVCNGGKHIKVRWTDASGRGRLLVLPCSPSDSRSAWNYRAQLRRLLRADEQVRL